MIFRGSIFYGFMVKVNLRFDIGEKCRGVVKPHFSPMPKGEGRAESQILYCFLQHFRDVHLLQKISNDPSTRPQTGKNTKKQKITKEKIQK